MRLFGGRTLFDSRGVSLYRPFIYDWWADRSELATITWRRNPDFPDSVDSVKGGEIRHMPDSDGGGRPDVRQSGELLSGRRRTDQRLRLTRTKPQSIAIPERPIRKRRWRPGLVLVQGFSALILVGTLLLSLPFSTVDGVRAPIITALFTATSAVCVTGLVVVDTATYWSPFGQAVIMLLIQLGGFGFMTSSTLLFLFIGRRISLRERFLVREEMGTQNLEATTTIVRRTFYFTFIVEAVGAVLLALAFSRHVDAPTAVWWGLFHSVSSFNNAGFDLTGDFASLIPFQHDPLVLLPLAVLIVLGGISFMVLADLTVRRVGPLALDTKLVVATSSMLLVLGTVMFLVTEHGSDFGFGQMPFETRLLNSFFMSVSARTAGFASIDLARMSENGLLVLMLLMFIGGSAGSTAGGIKVQTFGVLVFAIVSVIRGSTEVEAFRRRVPSVGVFRALSVAALSALLVFVMTLTLSISEAPVLLALAFEAVSAYGTVGLSTGITGGLGDPGRLALIVTMLLGRLGVLTFVFALASREGRAAYRWSEEGVRIG